MTRLESLQVSGMGVSTHSSCNQWGLWAFAFAELATGLAQAVNPTPTPQSSTNPALICLCHPAEASGNEEIIHIILWLLFGRAGSPNCS